MGHPVHVLVKAAIGKKVHTKTWTLREEQIGQCSSCYVTGLLKLETSYSLHCVQMLEKYSSAFHTSWNLCHPKDNNIGLEQNPSVRESKRRYAAGMKVEKNSDLTNFCQQQDKPKKTDRRDAYEC